MRRNKRFGVYSGGSIKRCNNQFCCRYSVEHYLDPNSYNNKLRVCPEEVKIKKLKQSLHLFAYGKKVHGKRLVAFSQKHHRVNARRRNSLDRIDISKHKHNAEFIDLNLRETSDILLCLNSETAFSDLMSFV